MSDQHSGGHTRTWNFLEDDVAEYLQERIADAGPALGDTPQDRQVQVRVLVNAAAAADALVPYARQQLLGEPRRVLPDLINGLRYLAHELGESWDEVLDTADAYYRADHMQ